MNKEYKNIMNKLDKIYIAGHKGLAGSAIVRHLKRRGFTNLILRTSKELDLSIQRDVENFFYMKDLIM